jgi:callose synthase
VLAELERPADEYTDPRSGALSDESFFQPIAEHVTMQTAVAEVWELGSFLFVQVLGPVHSADIHAVCNMVNKWAENGEMTAHLQLHQIREIMKHFVGAINILEKGLQKRKPVSRPKVPKRNGEAKTTARASGLRRVLTQTASLERALPRTKANPWQLKSSMH